MLQTLESQVLEVYRQADHAVTAFREATALACPGGCVHCCFSEKVEATVLEMIPAAYALFRANQAELILKRIEKEHDSKQCLLFRPDLSTPDSGGCTIYPYRALVCRLFGFAGNTDRDGVAQLARCRRMPLVTPPTAGADGSGPAASLPIFHSFGLAVTAIHPGLGGFQAGFS